MSAKTFGPLAGPLAAPLALALATVMLSGCFTSGSSGGSSSAPGGPVIDARMGAGTEKLNASGVGTLLGAFVGRDIADSLDKEDQQAASKAMTRAYAAHLGEVTQWSNPKSGNSGTITTTREGYNTANTYCREFRQTVTVKGKTELAYGTACKQADGGWKIVKNS
ncbi:surface antigen [Azospirillum fermentarium]|uniref:RT0821/Lpp0805 family surface protein n=1 Tax=Azospirillum fermentarium TaxID=1233114 RepID=UPI0022267045|nr:RT0821/Lpp0805 family surface protein [Azospirillum fermentarium]MCW2247147.1 surface antigen [Azospirillum fermentarium]